MNMAVCTQVKNQLLIEMNVSEAKDGPGVSYEEAHRKELEVRGRQISFQL